MVLDHRPGNVGRPGGRFLSPLLRRVLSFAAVHLLRGARALCRLREANLDAAAGSLREVQRIVGQIRARWPEVRIILRGTSEFCRDEPMEWCEGHQVDSVLEMARNRRLRQILATQLAQAAVAYQRNAQTARPFTFSHETTIGSWSSRRVIGKAAHLAGNNSLVPAATWRTASKSSFKMFAGRVCTEIMRASPAGAFRPLGHSVPPSVRNTLHRCIRFFASAPSAASYWAKATGRATACGKSRASAASL